MREPRRSDHFRGFFLFFQGTGWDSGSLDAAFPFSPQPENPKGPIDGEPSHGEGQDEKERLFDGRRVSDDPGPESSQSPD